MPNKYNAKVGKREDLGNLFFRSSWEANFARLMNYAGIEWQYEPRTFNFDDIQRGTTSYTPDFYLPKFDKWIEIKGWMDKKSKLKIDRFRKRYPDESSKLVIITAAEYKFFDKIFKTKIDGWE